MSYNTHSYFSSPLRIHHTTTTYITSFIVVHLFPKSPLFTSVPMSPTSTCESKYTDMFYSSIYSAFHHPSPVCPPLHLPPPPQNPPNTPILVSLTLHFPDNPLQFQTNISYSPSHKNSLNFPITLSFLSTITSYPSPVSHRIRKSHYPFPSLHMTPFLSKVPSPFFIPLPFHFLAPDELSLFSCLT